MATTYGSPGDVIPVIAPTGGVSSGDVIVVGDTIGVCLHDAAAGATVQLAVEGIFDCPAATADTIASGDKLYWDAGNACFTVVSTAMTATYAIACEAKATGVTVMKVKLPGIGIG